MLYPIPHGEIDFVKELERRKISAKVTDWHLEAVTKYNQIKNLSKSKTCKDYVAVFERWCKLHEIYQDQFFLSGINQNGKLLKKTWTKIEKQDMNLGAQIQFYERNHLLKSIKARWNVIILPTLWPSLKENKISHFEFMIYFHKKLVPGHFHVVDRADCRFGTTYMLVKFSATLDLLIGLLPERYPVYHNSEESMVPYYIIIIYSY